MNPEEIEERSRRMKEKEIEKARSGVTVYLGAALVIVMLSFVLYSNLPLGWQQNTSSAPEAAAKGGIEVNLSMPAKEKPARKEVVEVSPPVPEDFAPENLTRVVLVDDAQSAFWSNLEPTAVVFDDDFEDKKSGKSSLRVRFVNERKPWAFAEYTYPELQDWSGIKFVSFWFRGNKTGVTFDVYVYFNKKWNNYVVFRLRDVYSGWQRFVFSTERNVIKVGDVDWSRVWKLRITNNNRSYLGGFHFDGFTLWFPEGYRRERTQEEESSARVYGIGETATVGNLSVTLLRFRDRYEVVNYVGSKTYTEEYARVDLRIENRGSSEIKLSLTPYKPAMIDDTGKTYDYYYVKVRTRLGNWVPHEEQLKFDVLYPGAIREGAIFFKPVPGLNAKEMRLILYLNGRRYEFRFSRW